VRGLASMKFLTLGTVIIVVFFLFPSYHVVPVHASEPSLIGGSSGFASGITTPPDMSEITDPNSSSTTVLIDKANTITASNVATFGQTGLDNTAVGTIVTIDGASKTFNDLPFSMWVNEGDTITYSYSCIVPSTVAGKRFSLKEVTGPASPITCGKCSINVLGHYEVEYEVTFDQSGVDGNYNGTVVTVDGDDYGVTDLPVSLWWHENSVHNFAFHSPLIVTPNAKIHLWTSTSGLSTLQNDSITVSTSGSITGNYKTQYYLKVQTDPAGLSPAPNPSSDWYDENVNVTLTAADESYIDSAKHLFDYWSVDGVSQGSAVNPITVYMNQTHVATAHYKLPTYTLTVSAATGGATNPAVGDHTYAAGSSVGVTAIPEADYIFDHWELDSVNVGSTNPYTVLMDKNHTLEAIFAYSPPLSVSISPLSASILVGDSVSFTSTVGGGTSPYTHQWFLNDDPVPGATSSSWTFTPTSSGVYYIYLKVTDANDNTAQSDAARIAASAFPVGGYSVSLSKNVPAIRSIIYTMLMVMSTVALSLLRRKIE